MADLLAVGGQAAMPAAQGSGGCGVGGSRISQA